MIRLEYQYDNNSEKVVIEADSHTSLLVMLDIFERFLRAATYCFDGHLEIVEPIEDTVMTIGEEAKDE
jgi:peptidyl-tRNA hydrolase